MLNTSISVIVYLITRIIGLLKAEEDMTQYIRGRDTNKRLSKYLKENFGLQRDGCAYRIDGINSKVVHISARILVSKVVWGN